ncbi:MAG: rhomboid family intramembrane serine protease [Chitinophagales bacterium]|nr:rhomboid family intramembrane serine protease [Chitinophagales bacterium]MDW8428236.1 rhomboid family intramembrane serine protease [Chitinophagales bacterium]
MSVVLIIILITVLFSYSGFRQPLLLERMAMRPYAIAHHGEWWRFITSGLIHANWPHLLINMLVLYSFGTVVLRYYQLYFDPWGTALFILLYVAGIVVSDLPTYFRYRHVSWYASLGASGAVSAVTFAFVLIDPRNTIFLMGMLPMPAIVWGVLYLAYSHIMSYRGGDNINHSAHFTGAVFGLAFTAMLRPAFMEEFLRKLLGY